MKNATKTVVSTFGVLAGIMGIEHGLGEVLQGNTAPEGIMFPSWPNSAFFEILAGEPAMSLIPNMLVTGILAILVSLVFLLWVALGVQRKRGGPVLILLSIVMLLVGGGFGPPLLGIMVGMAATKVSSSLREWRTHLPLGLRQFFGKLWPGVFVACIIAWLLVFPGTTLFDRFVGMGDPMTVVPTITFSAFGLLLLAILTGLAHDSSEPSIIMTNDRSSSAICPRSRPQLR